MAYSTLAEVQQQMVGDRGPVMALARMDGATYLTPNPDLAAPIAKALLRLRIGPASPVAVADADVAQVGMGRWAKFTDVADAFLLERILGRWVLVSATSSGVGKSTSDLMRMLQAEKDAKFVRHGLVTESYGPDVASGQLVQQGAILPAPGLIGIPSNPGLSYEPVLVVPPILPPEWPMI